MKPLEDDDGVHYQQPPDYEAEHAVGVLSPFPTILIEIIDLRSYPLIFKPLPFIGGILDDFLIDYRWRGVNDGLKADDGNNDARRRLWRLDGIHSLPL